MKYNITHKETKKKVTGFTEKEKDVFLELAEMSGRDMNLFIVEEEKEERE